MNQYSPFVIQKDNIFAVPILHSTMEIAAEVYRAFREVQPDCVAVELAETMEKTLIQAASRLPDVSVAISYSQNDQPIYYLCEPCDAAFEAIRHALEKHIPPFCIDLDIDEYPSIREPLPDPYAIHVIGLKNYYEAYKKYHLPIFTQQDRDRELYMAKRLKELSLQYDTVLFVCGMTHLARVLDEVDRLKYPELKHADREMQVLHTLTEESCREVLAEPGWVTKAYEIWREGAEGLSNQEIGTLMIPDRRLLLYRLYKTAGQNYAQETRLPFPGYHLRNLMKFARNYSLLTDRLTPDLFQLLSVAKGCVDHNYAYETWKEATDYPFLKNVDNLPEIDLSPQDIWKGHKTLHFRLKQPGRKPSFKQRLRKEKQRVRLEPPGPFRICSYPPEDSVIETFGNFLKKKGSQILLEEGARSVPFSTSLEDGIDTRETIRHWGEKKLYVKMHGKPPGGVGSVVIIFDEDQPQEGHKSEKYPWCTTWIGEHEQESDMALYATDIRQHVVGPGISRAEYGGLMMSYPPRRMWDVWHDPDYQECRTKAEVLLMAAIDYAVSPLIVYVAAKPPRQALKSFAQRFGKKIVYIPIGQLSPVTLNRIRVFHVLDGHDKRAIADDYIH